MPGKLWAAASTLAVGLVGHIRHVDVNDKRHLAVSASVLLVAATRVILALLPAERHGQESSAHRVDQWLVLVSWLAVVILYGIHACTNTLTESFKSFYSTSFWQYRSMELFLTIAFQVPLYACEIFPTWVVLTAACVEALLTSIVAVEHLPATFLQHYPISFLIKVLAPFAMYTSQQRKAPLNSQLYNPSDNRSMHACQETAQFHDNARSPCNSVANANNMKDCRGCSSTVSSPVSLLPKDREVQHTATPVKSALFQSPSSVQPASKLGCEVNRTGAALTARLPTMPAASHKHNTAGASCRQPCYESKLMSRRRMAAVKINTDMDPSQLPNDLVTNLQASLHDICGVGYSISNIAIRHGCIMITTELLANTTAKTRNYAADGEEGNSQALSQLAQAVLPALQPLMNTQLSDGDWVRVQLDDSYVHCLWNAEQEAWQLNDVTKIRNANQAAPQLGLVRRSMSGSGGKSEPTDEGSSTVSNSTKMNGTSAGRGVARNTIVPNDLVLDVDLTGMFATANGQDLQQLITGWQPPSHKHISQQPPWGQAATADAGAQSPQPLAYKLLAHSRGVYIETEVLGIKQVASDDSLQITVRLHVQQTPACLYCHHYGQDQLCVQLLTLELWSDELLISSTAAVLPPQAATCSKQQSQAATPQGQCWWWGSRPAIVTAAMSELEEYVEKLHTTPGSESVQTYQDLMYDVSAWLSYVRDILIARHACKMNAGQSMLLSAAAMEPVLNFEESQQLASDLVSFAEYAQLPRVARMLKQQLRQVSNSRSVIVRKGSSVIKASSWMQWVSEFKTSICGFHCYQCERAYQTQLPQHLASVLTMYAGVAVMMGIVSFLAACRDRDALLMSHVLIWTVPQAMVVWCQAQGGIKHAYAPCSFIYALPLIAATLNWGTMATGLLTAPSFIMNIYQTPLSLVFHLVMSFDQLQASVILPAPIVAMCALVIAASMTLLGSNTWQQRLVYGPLHILVTVLARLVVDMHLRAILVSKKPQKATYQVTNKNK